MRPLRPSSRPFAILLTNERRISWQRLLMVRAASMTGASRLWVAHKVPFLEGGDRGVGARLVVEFPEGKTDPAGARGLQMVTGALSKCADPW
jgi:hypothetical protein